MGLYQAYYDGSTAGAGWTCPNCNQFVPWGTFHACGHHIPAEQEALPVTLTWPDPEAEALRAEVGRLTEQLAQLRAVCQKEKPFDADSGDCVRCSQYEFCLAEYEEAFARL